uniref:hypothetical protein n=1 Tax=Bacteroides ovatus TaxID=28116 RepID=UPI001899DA3A
MKGLLKNLGLILILAGVVILLGCSFTGNVNNNAILGTSVVLVVLGLISYIVINKKIVDRNGLETLHTSTQIIIAPGYNYKIV